MVLQGWLLLSEMERGLWFACLARSVVGNFSPFLVECLALREDLEFAPSCNLRIAWLESDARNIIRAVLDDHFEGAEGVVTQDIKRL